MIVWTNKWKNIRINFFDFYRRHKRLRDGHLSPCIEHRNKRFKCTFTKSRDVAFIQSDNCMSQLRHLVVKPPLYAFCLSQTGVSQRHSATVFQAVRLLAWGFMAVCPDTPKAAISIALVNFYRWYGKTCRWVFSTIATSSTQSTRKIQLEKGT